MKASEANLLKFLKKSPQFVIPIYQRNYSWTVTQCEQLWQDLLRAGRDDKINAHFIGAIVYVERALSNVISQESLLVIDGQQRLTTTTLLIAALAQHFEQHNLAEILDTFSGKKLRNYYLVNPDEEGERHFKLLLSETDRDTLLAIIKDAPLPPEASTRITENHRLFRQWIAQKADQLPMICRGLAKLVIVDVSLDRAQDNPQLIFESMNSTGLELSQADLIRNYILMGLEPALQTELYTRYWRVMEKDFGQSAYVEHFDAFMRHYLTAKTGDIPNVRDVYHAFKQFSRSFQGNVSALVADIQRYARYYQALALDGETEPRLARAFKDLRELRVDVAYPFLLDVYHDFQGEGLAVADVLQIVRLVESYVFRRAICGVPTNSLNKTFAALGRSLNKARYLESVQAALLLLPSYRRFPLDDEFLRHLKTRDLYNFRSRGYWLRRLENHGRKETVSIEEYTIEHILPQNENLSDEWQTELGPDWVSVRESRLHTLGNLTLSAYNSQYSDRSFAFKRDQVQDKAGNPIGFAYSPLRLNFGLGQVARWDEVAIEARAERLAHEAAKVWPAPQVAVDVLLSYRPEGKVGQQYGMADHPNLATGLVNELFLAFRKAALALDPCVNEEFLKWYVAYKAETNFVDIEPQAKCLRLMLNMPFAAIDDPRGICKNVTELSRLGNGSVEVKLTNVDDLPYVMGLVRQSFERQMGEPQNV